MLKRVYKVHRLNMNTFKYMYMYIHWSRIRI